MRCQVSSLLGPTLPFMDILVAGNQAWLNQQTRLLAREHCMDFRCRDIFQFYKDSRYLHFLCIFSRFCKIAGKKILLAPSCLSVFLSVRPPVATRPPPKEFFLRNYSKICREGTRLLTLRLLMSYIYIYMEHLFLMFLDHTQRRTTVGRTLLDE